MTDVRGRVQAIDRILLSVPDLASAERFYVNALGFSRISEARDLDADTAELLGAPGARIAASSLRLGAQTLDLLRFDPPGRPYPENSMSSDAWFQHCAIVVDDMGAAFAHLCRFAAVPITRDGPEVLPPSTGSVSAYKFRGPFGHPMELLHFPPGTGDPLWQKPAGGSIFLGIDHTAITVGSVDRSLSFYEALLGFEVSSRSFNRGPEQSRLDAVAHDRVTVVGLAPLRRRPHLELLGYEVGRRRPVDPLWQGADQVVTRTVMEVDDLGSLARRLERRAHPFRITGKGLALLDPDGHALILREPT